MDPLSKEEKTYIQEVIGTFLYYSRCVDALMLPALGTLATQQASPTKNTMKKIKQFLDFAATHTDAVVTYHASNMVLAGHSNASYLSKSNAQSRAGGYFFMSQNVETLPNNGAVFTAKIGTLSINCREAVPARHLLEFMGHKQPPTPMQTDNTTALGVVNKNVMKKLKSIDMKYHWLRCRISQMQFKHNWAAGSTNLGDYFTKHHPAIHHQTTRGKYRTDISTLMKLWNRQKGGYARMITSCSKGVLDRSGLPDTAVD